MTGTVLISWSARVAFLLYAAAAAGWLMGKRREARLAWTSGFLVYLGHVIAAFHFQHHWSHAAAYEATARQTAELFGVRVGSGLYWNYLFTAVWALDAAWVWWDEEAYRRRPRSITAGVHFFMAFLFFNATVVFGSGPPRWLGIVVFALMGFLWYRCRRRAPVKPPI